jgi:hypothetical protein
MAGVCTLLDLLGRVNRLLRMEWGEGRWTGGVGRNLDRVEGGPGHVPTVPLGVGDATYSGNRISEIATIRYPLI